PRVDKHVVAERRARWQAEHARRREAWAAAARRVQGDRPIDMAWLSRCVGDLVDERTIVVNEYDLEPTQTCFRAPGSYFNGPASDYGLVCRASRGHAERVEDPAALPGALARALKVVREEKRQALLNVICKKP